MSTEEPKSDEPKPKPDSPVASENGGVDAGVAWPPPEAAPEAQAAKPAEPDKPADPSPAAAEQPSAAAPAAAADDAAAMPEQEMGLSNSTLHWLEDESAPAHIHEPGTMPSYDPKAPVAGRTRAVLVVGGAALLAIAIAGYFYAQSAKRQAEAPPA